MVVHIESQICLLGFVFTDRTPSSSQFFISNAKCCQKASGKLKALQRIRPYLSVKIAKALCKGYILSNINYCPLIWMRFDKASNFLLDKVQRRALTVVYYDYHSNFMELLELSESVTFYTRFIRIRTPVCQFDLIIIVMLQ